MLTKVSEMVKHSELPKYSGCGLTRTDTMIREGEFPAGIPMTDGKQLRWSLQEILAWQNERIAIRNDPRAMAARAKTLKAAFIPKSERKMVDDAPPRQKKLKLKPPTPSKRLKRQA